MTPFNVGEFHRSSFSLGSFTRGEEPMDAESALIPNEWQIPPPPPPLPLAEFEDDMVDRVMWLGDDVPAFPPCLFTPRCSILCFFSSSIFFVVCKMPLRSCSRQYGANSSVTRPCSVDWFPRSFDWFLRSFDWFSRSFDWFSCGVDWFPCSLDWSPRNFHWFPCSVHWFSCSFDWFP